MKYENYRKQKNVLNVTTVLQVTASFSLSYSTITLLARHVQYYYAISYSNWLFACFWCTKFRRFNMGNDSHRNGLHINKGNNSHRNGLHKGRNFLWCFSCLAAKRFLILIHFENTIIFYTFSGMNSFTSNYFNPRVNCVVSFGRVINFSPTRVYLYVSE